MKSQLNSQSVTQAGKSKFSPNLTNLIIGNGVLPKSTITSSLVINTLGLALPLVLLQVYDRILVNNSLATLGYLMAGLFTAILIEAALKISRAYLMSWSATQQSYRSNYDAIKRCVNTPSGEFDKFPANVWMDRFEALDRFNAFTSGQSRLILLDLPFVAIYLTVIVLVAGNLGFVLVGTIALFATIICLRAKALRTVLVEHADHASRQDDFIAETLSGIESIKGLAMEPQMQRRFERLQQTNAAITHRNILLSNELQIYSQTAGNFVLVSMITFGGYMAIGGQLSVGALACCTLLTSRIMQPVMRGIQVLMELEGAQLARKQASTLFEGSYTPMTADTGLKVIRGGIDLEHVSIVYEGTVRPALNDLSLSIKPGEIIGIRGEHASGRSTLVKLIGGEVVPTSGTFSIDGMQVEDIPLQQLHSEIVYVSQDSAIFEGTIMENLTMFQAGPERQIGAREAAQLIDLEDDIHRMPQGYDTPVGRGIAEALPRGMVQRIVIARALAANPKILLFDEANSMLDMRSDNALKDGLKQLAGKTTVILISNRPSLLAIADRCYSMTLGDIEVHEPYRPPVSKKISA